MLFPRMFVAVLVSLLLAFVGFSSMHATSVPLGILTLADHAHLDEADAFAGLSVFEGEYLSTDAEGRLGVRVGQSTLALGAKTEAVLFKVSNGLHVDMAAGSLFFSAASNERVEIHVAEATLQPDGVGPTQALVTVLAPQVLQISARRGGLDFSYHREFRNLPEGQTYRIYLDAPTEPKELIGTRAEKTGTPGHVAYFIVGAGFGGVTGWGTHAASRYRNCPESPARP